MKEITFRNRVPAYPGRVVLTPVAGQANTYDLVRADQPTEAGTPLNKTAFDSIIQSRLTGRYYSPTLSRNVYSARTGVTTSPLPTSGWVEDANDSYKASSGIYTVTVSSDQASHGYGYEAFTSSGWESLSSPESWIQIYHSQAIKVRAMSFYLDMENSRLTKMVIAGSNNGTSWTTLYSATTATDNATTTYNLTTTGEFTYYRITFTSSTANGITLSNWKYTLYDINAYTNAYTVSDNFPTSWTTGQRVMLATPTTVNTFSVVANTLNGVTINTILQQGKYYELRYTGSAFTAKEV